MNTLKQSLEQGKPFVVSVNPSEQAAITALGEVVQATSLEAHKEMYKAYKNRDSSVVVFTDDDANPGKYVSFRDANGDPCYMEFEKGNSATDIGIRGVNPEFEGVINPTTIMHADVEAVHDFRERGAPEVVIRALDATRLFNDFIVKKIAKPYIEQVATLNGLDPDEYMQHFFPFGERAHTLTRVIMYHLDAKEGMRPVGEADGVPLLIAAHGDKGSITIDTVQTSSGLEYLDRKTGKWLKAGTDIACFWGSAESYLPTAPPPTIHRVVYEEDLRQKADPKLLDAGLGRIAIPTFISPVKAGDRETISHPDVLQTDSVAI